MKHKFASFVFAAFVAMIMTSPAFGANETSCNAGGACPGQGGNGGAGGSGGTAISGASSKASANPVAVASGGDSAGGSATASGNGGSASNGAVSNSVTTGNVRSLSLGAAAVGSPANGTCAGYIAVAFGLLTFPVTLESCAALQEAMILDQFGSRKSAIQRLCQLKEISTTDICIEQLLAKQSYVETN